MSTVYPRPLLTSGVSSYGVPLGSALDTFESRRPQQVAMDLLATFTLRLLPARKHGKTQPSALAQNLSDVAGQGVGTSSGIGLGRTGLVCCLVVVLLFKDSNVGDSPEKNKNK